MARKKKETVEEVEVKEEKKPRRKLKEELEKVEEEVEEVEELKVDSDDLDEDDEYEELTVEDRLINLEKKSNLILILVVVCIAFSLITMMAVLKGGVGTKADDSNGSSSSSSSSSSYDISAFKKIKATDIVKESEGELIVVWLGRQGCGYCSKFAPVMTEVTKAAGITARYIDVEDFLDITTSPYTVTDKTAYDTIANLKGVSGVDVLDPSTGQPKALRGTPCTLFMKDGKIVNIISGYVSAEDLYGAFQRIGLVK